MANEYLGAYDREGHLIKVAERSQLLREMREHSERHRDSPFAVETVFLILLNARDELYIVQRGEKPENPWRFDKSVGGHVAYGDTCASTLFREADEEIGVTLVLARREAAQQVLENVDTSRFAVAWEIAFDPWLDSLRAVTTGEPWLKRHRAMIYAGRYDGPVVFKDGEAASLEKIRRADFSAAYAARRHEFTHDMGVLLERWWDRLNPID